MIRTITLHKVGNKSLDESLFLSDQPLSLDESLEATFSEYFLSSLKNEEYYRFYHDIDLKHNEVYACVSAIFDDPSSLQEQSGHLARHLYGQSLHPRIKGGEFYVVYFNDCTFGGQTCEAIGLYKSENRDTFLDVRQVIDGFDIQSRQGVNIHKLDKGCLIYRTERDQGYVLSIVDNTNKGSEARYWKDDFLSVSILSNPFHQTNQFLSIAKQFVTKQLDEDFEVTKTDKIDYLNRSVEYFKNHEAFDKQAFEEQVFGDGNVIDSFRKFDQQYREQNELELADTFEISPQAVKKQARVFKSVLKLDKNFHIYIHGNRELIEQGIDEKGRKYYKIYYEQEL